MSSNTTLLAPTTVRDVLRVYTVHETGVDQETTTRTKAARGKTSLKTQQVQAETKQDANWPQDWRGMPSYRETNRSHRLADRPAGKDVPEGVIVTVMFTGVFMAGVSQPPLFLVSLV